MTLSVVICPMSYVLRPCPMSYVLCPFAHKAGFTWEHRKNRHRQSACIARRTFFMTILERGRNTANTQFLKAYGFGAKGGHMYAYVCICMHMHMHMHAYSMHVSKHACMHASGIVSQPWVWALGMCLGQFGGHSLWARPKG